MLKSVINFNSLKQYHQLTSVIDASGNNALHYACWGGHFELAKNLIEKKQFDPSVKNVEGIFLDLLYPFSYAFFRTSLCVLRAHIESKFCNPHVVILLN
jgi:ankyrin repeat protein